MGFLSDYKRGVYAKPKEEAGLVGKSLDYLFRGLKAVDVGPSEETLSSLIPPAPAVIPYTPDQEERRKRLLSMAMEAGMGSGGSLKIGRPIGKLLDKLIGRIPEEAVTTKGNQLLADLIKSGTLTEEQVVANASKVGAVARKHIKNAMAGATPEAKASQELVALYQNPELATTPEASIQKITDALKGAKPIRASQEAVYHTERSQQAGRLAKVQQTASGEAGFKEQLAVLKGDLPKVEYESVRNALTQTDVDNLFTLVSKNNILRPFEKINAQRGLQKLLGAEGGRVPTEKELELLSEVFPQQFIESVLSNRGTLSKVWQGGLETLSIPRAIMASADLSAPFRQGIVLSAGHPKQAYYAFKDMFRYAFSESAYKGLLENIKARPTYQLMRANKLALTDLGPTLTSREEAFMSRLPEKLPLLGRMIRGSNRAYSGYLTKLRADVFDSLVADASKLGLDVSERSPVLKNLTDFINIASGRGNLGKLKALGPALNATLFSPRLIASRLQTLNPAYYIKLDPFTRKEALKSLASFVGLGTTVLGLAAAGGLDVTLDPRHSDFGKIRVGDTRLDVWGGFAQYVKFFAQMVSGQTISSTTGLKREVGKGFPSLSRFDILQNFITSKEAPIPAFATAALKGKDVVGKQFDTLDATMKLFVPMVIQDMADATQEHGWPMGLALSAPSVFGVGVQTQTKDAEQTIRASNTLKQGVATLKKEGKFDVVRDLMTRNKEMFATGQSLAPLQKQINRLDKMREYLKNNPTLSPDAKKLRIQKLDEAQQRLRERRDTLYKSKKESK